MTGMLKSVWVTRRGLQLAVGLTWLLDAALQYQPYMFSRSFSSHVIASAARGNPVWVAQPITWAAALIGQHVWPANAAFATIQLAIALGIFWRRTTAVALAISVPWAISVWWLGEGLGGVLTSSSSAVSGAPGAAIMYALLAVLLWPAADQSSGVVAYASPAGQAASRIAWVTLWTSLAYDCVLRANLTPGGLATMTAALGRGEPGWLAAVDSGVSAELAGRGGQVSAVLAAAFAVIAVAVFVPAIRRAAVVIAMCLALVIWTAGQDFGGILTGSATDPNSGLLLILVALAYWPRRAVSRHRLKPHASPPRAAFRASLPLYGQ
jgi:hypothetical protein